MDYAVRIFSIAGLAMPSFWLGIVFILVMLIVFKWLPPMVYTPFWVNPWQNMLQLIWPALAVGYRYSAVATRMTRSAMLEVLREDYIRTARAKGLVQKLILSRHALKNAMLPVLTVIALEFAFLIGGLVVTEQVFNLNGIGLLFVQAVAHRDYTLIQALVMLVAGFFIVVNFAMDVMYAWLDPRIRYPVRCDGASKPAGRPRGRRSARAPSRPSSGHRGRPRLLRGTAPLGAVGRGGHRCVMLVVAVFAPLHRALRSGRHRLRGHARRAVAARTGSAPTPSAATCSRASSTARARRCWWASAPR